jgi:hypothetical protein
MRRTRTLLIAASGAALSMLLGSGLLALVSDSVTSPGNAATSGTYTPVLPHDVKAALLKTNDLGVFCNGATPLSDGPLPTYYSQTIGLSGGTVSPSNDICVRNDGTQTGQVRISITNVVDTENDGAAGCLATESGAGDTTCGPGADGELSGILTAAFHATPLAGDFKSTSCAALTPLSSFAGSGIIDTDLAPGETCRVYLSAAVAAATTDIQRFVAQTDRVQFDIVATLEDMGP